MPNSSLADSLNFFCPPEESPGLIVSDTARRQKALILPRLVPYVAAMVYICIYTYRKYTGKKKEGALHVELLDNRSFAGERKVGAESSITRAVYLNGFSGAYIVWSERREREVEATGVYS